MNTTPLISSIRTQFPIFHNYEKKKHQHLIYLDSAASSQKPEKVIKKINKVYTRYYSNIHRGAYPISEVAYTKYEETRKKVAKFIHSKSHREIVFTRGTTESINLVARSLGDSGMLKKGDRIILSTMEHHANIVPWLQLKNRIGIKLDYIDFNQKKDLILKNLEDKLKEPTKLIAITHVSNVLGTINPIKKICELAKKHNVLSLVDGAQAIAHFPVDVQDINCDFYTFSSHKMYGPAQVGILYGRLELLKRMPSFIGGGDMIHEVSLDNFTENEVPQKFEAGTPGIAEVISFGAAIDFIHKVSTEEIYEHNKTLTNYLQEKLQEIKEIKVYSHKDACGIVSFTISKMSDYDIGDELGERGICVRVGHHCAQPLLNILKVPTLIRASFGVYNTGKDIDILTDALKEIIAKLK